MQRLRSLLPSFLGGRSGADMTRMEQFKIDVQVLSFLADMYEKDKMYTTEEEMRSGLDSMPTSFAKKVKYLNDSIEKQVGDMFDSMEKAQKEAFRISSSSSMVAKRGQDTDQPDMSAVEEQWEILENLLVDSLKMCLQVKQSGVDHPKAGDGLFLKGQAKAGQVIAFYPGLVYLPYVVKRITDRHHRQRGFAANEDDIYFDLFGQEGKPNEHAIQRYDTAIINARDGSVAKRFNPYALGHKINHPPKGITPNVQVCPFDFSSNFVKKKKGTSFEDYIPNDFFQDERIVPKWTWWLRDKDVFMPSVVFMATRPIEDGEELFSNYRFNPALENQIPDWYHHVDEEEARRRWTH